MSACSLLLTATHLYVQGGELECGSIARIWASSQGVDYARLKSGQGVQSVTGDTVHPEQVIRRAPSNTLRG